MTEALGIAVVDDNDDCRELYSLWLSNHEVQTAENGTEALAQIDGEIDLVLLDRNMPGPNGLAVAETLRERGYENGIVLVSSEHREFDLDASPVDDYLQKPVDRDQIIDFVDRYGARLQYRTALDAFYASSATLGEIEAELSRDQLETCSQYEALRDRVERKRAAVDDALAGSDLRWEAMFSAIDVQADHGTPGAASDGVSPHQFS